MLRSRIDESEQIIDELVLWRKDWVGIVLAEMRPIMLFVLYRIYDIVFAIWRYNVHIEGVCVCLWTLFAGCALIHLYLTHKPWIVYYTITRYLKGIEGLQIPWAKTVVQKWDECTWYSPLGICDRKRRKKYGFRLGCQHSRNHSIHGDSICITYWSS